MLTVNDSIKQAYNQYTTQRKSYIQVGNNSFFIQNLDVSADAYYEGNVIGNAIAKIAKFDIETVNVNGIDEFELFDGIWTGNQYEYISLGTFKLFNEEGTDDFFSSITAYDKLINFNKEYDPSLTTYPTTIYGLLQNICSQAGVELENSSIPNGNQPLPSNLFVENETLKMILNAICQISGNFGIISKDKLKLLLKGTETVNLSKYQLSNPEYKRTTWKINQVVLGMKDVEGEYVLRQDYEDIEQNGVHKLVINDNPFVYRQDLREAYIDNLFNQVKGFGYIAFETTWEGLSYVELGDLLNLDGKESIVLRYSLKSPHGLNSTLSAPSIIDSVIDYVDNSNSIANRQRRTELWVNKELGEIKSEVVDVETTVENITTTTQTSTGKNNLHITDSLESNALEYHVEGKSEQDGEPTPDYPSEIKTIKGIRNLLNITDGSYHSNGITATVLDGKINVVGTCVNSNSFIRIPIEILLDGNYTFSLNTKNEGTLSTGEQIRIEDSGYQILGSTDILMGLTTFTVENTKAEYLNIRTSLGATVSYDIMPMLEKGPIAHDYIPYGAWAKVKIDNNLFENKNLTSGKYINIDGELISNTSWSVTDFIEVIPNNNYGIMIDGSIDLGNLPSTVFYDKDKNYISGLKHDSKIIPTYTTPSNCFYIKESIPTSLANKIKIFSGLEYKEKEVLIDLSKPNLFDKNNVNVLNGNVNAGNIASSNNAKTLYIEITGGKTYTVSKISSQRFRLGTTTELPNINVPTNIYVGDVETATSKTITTGNNDNYLCVYYYLSGTDTLTEQEILDSIKIYEGYTDYYELSSTGDAKDELNIIDGQVVIDKKIEKIIFNGTETWNVGADGTNAYYTITPTNKPLINTNLLNCMCNKYRGVKHADRVTAGDNIIYFTSAGIPYIRNTSFTTKTDFVNNLKNENADFYYILATPQQITLSNIQIPLFEGVNHITLVDDLETTTSIKYYRNTPIAQDYVVQQQLDETNSNLSTTTDKTNQNASDINATNTNLNNNYYNKDQIDVMNTSTQEIVTQIKNQVETTTTATNLQISILQEQLTNGVTAVRTETGYTFDKDGLKIQKSGSEMSSLLDNDGLVVKRNETEVLTVRSSGVETENLTVRTHFIIGDNTRVENYKGGTGFFYIGGAN